MSTRAICLGTLGLGAACLLAAGAGGAWAQSGHALEFDGVDDWVEISDPVNVTGPLTLEAWIRVDEFDGGRIFSNRGDTDGYELDVMTNGSLRFTIDGNARAMVDISAHLGQWVHVAVTWAGLGDGGIVMYVDGETAATGSFAGSMATAGLDLAIGTAAWSRSSFPFHGAIDEPRIFATVVDGATIRTWMTRRISPDHPDYADLQGAWSFEEGSGQTATCSVAGRDGRLGDDPGADGADPIWIGSGMVAARPCTWGHVKGLFRD